jgi:tellurium resistance protein TerD
MVQLAVKKGDTRNLPRGGNFTVGVGWDPGAGISADDKVDLDVWVIRNNNGTGEPACWANEGWHRPDLGSNSEGKPWIATPELDIIHQGDDTTGATSDGDYDELVKLDLTKAPAGVSKYDVFVTYYEDPDSGSGKTLGMASNIKCGVKDDITGNELTTDLANEYGFDVTVHICTIERKADGSWAMEAVHTGYAESMFEVMTKFGVTQD